MSLRITLIALVAAGLGGTLRVLPTSADFAALPDPPSTARRAAAATAPLDRETLHQLSRTPLKFVDPIDPSKLPQPAVDPVSLRLVGVIMAPRRALAILTSNGGAPQTVARGEEIGGWRVTAIDERRVRLTRGRDTVEKTLFERARQSETVAQTATPPAPAPAPTQLRSTQARPQESTNAPPVIYMPPAPPINQ